jgi:hypothetical protein
MSDDTSDGTRDDLREPDGNPQPGLPPPPPFNPRLDLIGDMHDPDYRLSDDYPDYRLPDGTRPPSHRRQRRSRWVPWFRLRVGDPARIESVESPN